MTTWFERYGFSMDRLPPFQYSLDAPSLSYTGGDHETHLTRSHPTGYQEDKDRAITRVEYEESFL